MKKKKHWFLKAELLVLFCLVVLWIVDLKTDCVPRAAAGALKQVVRAAPNCRCAHELLYDTYTILGRYDKAFEASERADFITCKRTVQLDPNDAHAHFNLGYSYHYYQDDLEHAIEHYKEAVRINPNYPWRWICLGDAYMSSGNYDQAINAYEEAVMLDLEDSHSRACLANGYFELGLAHEKSERNEEAQACFQKAMQIDSDIPKTLFRFGNLNCEEGNWTDAIECYNLSLKLNPNNPEVHYNLCKAYLQTDDKDLALEEYEILKALDEELANELFELIHE